MDLKKKIAYNILYAYIFLSYYNFSAPSGSPINPSGYAIDSTTIILSWSPPLPEEQNGIIRQYIIDVTELDTGDTFSFNSTNTETTLPMLHPFYTYEFTITAVTVDPGPPTPPFTVQMEEDGELH